jgi:hypothetical protein
MSSYKSKKSTVSKSRSHSPSFDSGSDYIPLTKEKRGRSRSPIGSPKRNKKLRSKSPIGSPIKSRSRSISPSISPIRSRNYSPSVSPKRSPVKSRSRLQDCSPVKSPSKSLSKSPSPYRNRQQFNKLKKRITRYFEKDDVEKDDVEKDDVENEKYNCDKEYELPNPRLNVAHTVNSPPKLVLPKPSVKSHDSMTYYHPQYMPHTMPYDMSHYMQYGMYPTMPHTMPQYNLYPMIYPLMQYQQPQQPFTQSLLRIPDINEPKDFVKPNIENKAIASGLTKAFSGEIIQSKSGKQLLIKKKIAGNQKDEIVDMQKERTVEEKKGKLIINAKIRMHDSEKMKSVNSEALNYDEICSIMINNAEKVKSPIYISNYKPNKYPMKAILKESDMETIGYEKIESKRNKTSLHWLFSKTRIAFPPEYDFNKWELDPEGNPYRWHRKYGGWQFDEYSRFVHYKRSDNTWVHYKLHEVRDNPKIASPVEVGYMLFGALSNKVQKIIAAKREIYE